MNGISRYTMEDGQAYFVREMLESFERTDDN